MAVETFSTVREIELAGPGRHRDEKTTGLYLYVSPKGVRRWILRYTRPNKGGVTETSLGGYPVVTLNQARAEVLKKQRLIAGGVDPVQARREHRAAQTTFAEAAQGWIDTHKVSWRSESQMRNATLLLHRHGAPLSGQPVAEISENQIQSALTELWSRAPAQARRTLAMWERVLDYARAKGLRTGDNPASWRGMHEYRFPRRRTTDKRHFAAMAYAQLPEFIQRLRHRQARSTGAVALEFLILTAARMGEVRNMQWSEIDWEQSLWTIPANRTKAMREHRVPLSDRAMQLVAHRRQYPIDSPYVFTGYSEGPLGDKAMSCVLSNMGVRETTHGFRSTFRDWAGDKTDFARETIEECLSHVVGNGVERAYRRQDGLDKRRAVMNAWAAYCEGQEKAPNSRAEE
jgi:integrase